MSHKVKCYYCGNIFDRDKVLCEPVGAKRYAHLECSNLHKLKVEKEKQDLIDLHNYIKKLFEIDTIPQRIEKQINTYVTKNNYTYSGILKALTYFYDIKGNTTEKANGGIGIVPYVYEDAFNYYYNIWLTNQNNEHKLVEQECVIAVREIHIPAPRKEIKKRKLFTFLDEEEEGEE